MWNKIILHIIAGLFSGFTFWMIGDGTFSLQLRLFAIFNFIFVAPGCINQMQPFFLHNRDIFETREKKVIATGTTVWKVMLTYSSRKHITGLHLLLPRLSLKSHTSSCVPLCISHVGTSPLVFQLMPASRAMFICR